MNAQYSNNPTAIGNYFSNNNVINTKDRFNILNPFTTNVHEVKKADETIMSVKTDQGYKQSYESIGTKVKKSCNTINQVNRFEHPGYNSQDINNIMSNEPFRGGIPSRIVAKDEYIENLN